MQASFLFESADTPRSHGSRDSTIRPVPIVSHNSLLLIIIAAPDLQLPVWLC